MATNATPLIGVMLVLVAVVVVAPRQIAVEEIQPPRRSNCGDDRPVFTITVRADLSVEITDEDLDITLPAGDLPSALRRHLSEQAHEVHIDFDDAVLWDQVVATVDTVKNVAPTALVALKVRD